MKTRFKINGTEHLIEGFLGFLIGIPIIMLVVMLLMIITSPFWVPIVLMFMGLMRIFGL